MGWEKLLDLVLALLPVLESRKEKDRQRVADALDALSDAYYSTVAYYEAERSGEFDIRQEQLVLAQKWDRVANLTRPYNKNLSSRFNLKSRFWREGEAWQPEEIASANIGLERIRSDARFELIQRQG